MLSTTILGLDMRVDLELAPAVLVEPELGLPLRHQHDRVGECWVQDPLHRLDLVEFGVRTVDPD
jgi:hypothetical protein